MFRRLHVSCMHATLLAAGCFGLDTLGNIVLEQHIFMLVPVCVVSMAALVPDFWRHRSWWLVVVWAGLEEYMTVGIAGSIGVWGIPVVLGIYSAQDSICFDNILVLTTFLVLVELIALGSRFALGCGLPAPYSLLASLCGILCISSMSLKLLSPSGA